MDSVEQNEGEFCSMTVPPVSLCDLLSCHIFIWKFIRSSTAGTTRPQPPLPSLHNPHRPLPPPPACRCSSSNLQSNLLVPARFLNKNSIVSNSWPFHSAQLFALVLKRCQKWTSSEHLDCAVGGEGSESGKEGGKKKKRKERKPGKITTAGSILPLVQFSHSLLGHQSLPPLLHDGPAVMTMARRKLGAGRGLSIHKPAPFVLVEMWSVIRLTLFSVFFSFFLFLSPLLRGGAWETRWDPTRWDLKTYGARLVPKIRKPSQTKEVS